MGFKLKFFPLRLVVKKIIQCTLYVSIVASHRRCILVYMVTVKSVVLFNNNTGNE